MIILTQRSKKKLYVDPMRISTMELFKGGTTAALPYTVIYIDSGDMQRAEVMETPDQIARLRRAWVSNRHLWTLDEGIEATSFAIDALGAIVPTYADCLPEPV